MKKLGILISIILILFCCTSCCSNKSIPGPEDASVFLRENRDDIDLIVSHILNQDCKTFLVYNTSEASSAQIDLEKVQIEDGDVVGSIRSLSQKGCYRIYKNIEWNCIEFSMWKRTRGEINCGFLYVLCSDQLPEVQFQTELIPLQEKGWYYYKAEYNKWRVNN